MQPRTPHGPTRAVSAVILSLAACLGCLGACKRAPSGDPPAESAASAAPSPSTGELASPSGPCGDLKQKLCGESGEESPTCAAAQVLLPLFVDEACKQELDGFPETLKKLKVQREDCDTLVTRLCAQVQPETCKMVKQTTEHFPPGQCTSMLTQFDAVLAELKKEDDKLKPVSGDLLVALHADNAPSFGPGDAKVTVVEFSDFQCPYCGKAAEVTRRIKEKYGQVRFVFRQFPLSFHTEAHKASEAALAAHTEGKFWTFHDKLFENQQALAPDSLRKYAGELGVSEGVIKQALDGSRFGSQVDADIELGNQVGVTGTPTMFINGKRVPNPTDFDAVAKLIDEQLTL